MRRQEHLDNRDYNKMMDSNSKMYDRPQECDYMFVKSEMDKVLSMRPLDTRVLVLQAQSLNHFTSLKQSSPESWPWVIMYIKRLNLM